MRSNLKKTISLLLCLFVAFFMSTRVHAHATMSDFYPNSDVNEEAVRFFFGDDEFMSDVSVMVYNTFGTQIGAGTTHERSHFDLRGFENAGHLIARYDADHIQIHLVAEGGMYIPYPQLGDLLRSFVMWRWWFGI